MKNKYVNTQAVSFKWIIVTRLKTKSNRSRKHFVSNIQQEVEMTKMTITNYDWL